MPVASARELFEIHMPRRFEEAPQLCSSVNARFQFVLTGDEAGTWLVDMTRSPGVVREEEGEAHCTITAAVGDFLDIVNGKLDGKMAVMRGKLKIAGDLALAMKLGSLLGGK